MSYQKQYAWQPNPTLAKFLSTYSTSRIPQTWNKAMQVTEPFQNFSLKYGEFSVW